MTEGVTFLAALPDKSGISRHSDGATVRFDVPETEIAAMAPLLALTRCVLRVFVTLERAEPLQNNTDQPAPTTPPARIARRRSERVE